VSEYSVRLVCPYCEKEQDFRVIDRGTDRAKCEHCAYEFMWSAHRCYRTARTVQNPSDAKQQEINLLKQQLAELKEGLARTEWAKDAEIDRQKRQLDKKITELQHDILDRQGREAIQLNTMRELNAKVESCEDTIKSWQERAGELSVKLTVAEAEREKLKGCLEITRTQLNNEEDDYIKLEDKHNQTIKDLDLKREEIEVLEARIERLVNEATLRCERMASKNEQAVRAERAILNIRKQIDEFMEGSNG